MNVADALGDVLDLLSDQQLRALADTCQPLSAPTGALASVIAGGTPAAVRSVQRLVSAWSATPTLTGEGVALALHTGLHARRDRDAARSRPVWTGPGAIGEQRLTASVLHELIANATHSILIVSYAAHTLPEIATDLEHALARGCTVDAVFETAADSDGQYSGPARPFADIHGITRWRWPTTNRQPGAALHAKLLVIDARTAFIGSANLTHRALTANLEAGLLINDTHLAGEFDAHVRNLMAQNVLVREGDASLGR